MLRSTFISTLMMAVSCSSSKQSGSSSKPSEKEASKHVPRYECEKPDDDGVYWKVIYAPEQPKSKGLTLLDFSGDRERAEQEAKRAQMQKEKAEYEKSRRDDPPGPGDMVESDLNNPGCVIC